MGAPSENIVRLAKKSLKRVLGSKELFAVGYGDVGSSIYYTLGATALFALGATPLALFLAGIVFVCTALTFAEMSTTYPEPGGSATFSRHAFNDLISFIAGWGLLLDYIVTLAISAFTVMPYLSSVFSFIDLPFLNRADVHVIGTVILIAILFFINLFGIKHSGRFTFILAIFTFVTQAGIVILGGLFVLNLPFVIEHLKIGVANASWSPDLWQFMKGTAIAMVAYTGIEAISQLAAETKQPSLMIPRAIKWTIVAILFLNIGISTVGLSVISPEELGTKYLENPVFGIAMHFPVGGAILGPWVGLIAAIVLLICANAGLIGCSRLTFSMGEYYQIPVSLFKIHSRFRTPYVSLAVFSILAALVVVLSRNQMMFLVDLYNFGAQIAFFSAHMALIILRFKKPSIHRPFKAPLNIPVGKGRSIPLTAIFGALASAMVWFMVVITKPEGRVMGLSWMAIGIGIYFYYRKKKKIAAITQLKIEEIKIPEYKPMQIKHILVVTRASGGTEALQTAYEMARHHKSKTTAVYILEVPHAIPVDASMLEREKKGELALKRAEAIAREYHITPELELVRSRSIEDAILHLIQTAEYDMVIIGTNKGEIRNRSHFALEASKLLHDAPCRVIFCKS